MNLELLLLTSYQIIIAFIFGLLTIFITLQVVQKTILKVNFFELVRQGNTALALFEGTLIVSTLLLVEVAILPSVNALQTMMHAHQAVTFQMFLISFGYFVTFYLIALVFSYILILSGFYVFVSATAKLDEIKEIKQNNIAVSIMISMVLLGLTIFIRPSLSNLVQSFVDYRSLEKTITEAPKKEGVPEQPKKID